jgi:flagellar biosynthesis protein FlhB
MANDDKTEKPTAKRRGEARRKGQVAKSADLNGATVLGAGLFAVIVMAPRMIQRMGSEMQGTFSSLSRPARLVSTDGVQTLLHQTLSTLIGTVAPVAAICVAAALIVNVAQVGFRPSLGALQPSFGKLNPINGARNLVGPRMFFDLAKSLAKVVVVGTVVVLALLPDLTQLGASVGTSPTALGSLMSAGVAGIAIRATAAYLLIGIVDYIWQKRRTEKAMKMSKHEVKEESKSRELPSEVRGAIRRRQIQAARARMMSAIPQADVVVTNPTHFAVALQYDGNKPAPIVVAKGQDVVAAQIRRIAEEHGIPIIPDPPLARELHRIVEIGQMIPAEMYAAVAQVLAFVYRLAARKKRGV